MRTAPLLSGASSFSKTVPRAVFEATEAGDHQTSLHTRPFLGHCPAVTLASNSLTRAKLLPALPALVVICWAASVGACVQACLFIPDNAASKFDAVKSPGRSAWRCCQGWWTQLVSVWSRSMCVSRKTTENAAQQHHIHGTRLQTQGPVEWTRHTHHTPHPAAEDAHQERATRGASKIPLRPVPWSSYVACEKLWRTGRAAPDSETSRWEKPKDKRHR